MGKYVGICISCARDAVISDNDDQCIICRRLEKIEKALKSKE